MQWQYVSRAIYGNAMRSAIGIIINWCNILLQCSLVAIYWTSAMCNWWLVWGQDFIIERGQSLCAICRWTAPGYTSCICMCICVYLCICVFLCFYVIEFVYLHLSCCVIFFFVYLHLCICFCICVFVFVYLQGLVCNLQLNRPRLNRLLQLKESLAGRWMRIDRIR